jgi:hypothetical protein
MWWLWKQKPFLLRCRDHDTIPRFLQSHHPIHSQAANAINAPLLPTTDAGVSPRRKHKDMKKSEKQLRK